MKDQTTNELRDAIIQTSPHQAGMIMSRDQVVDHWCETHGKKKDELSVSDIITIRSLPEWKNAG